MVLYGTFTTDTAAHGGALVYDPSYGIRSTSKISFENTHFGTTGQGGFGEWFNNKQTFLWTPNDIAAVETAFS